MARFNSFGRGQGVPTKMVRTDVDDHFTGALAQNAGENENIALTADTGTHQAVRCRIIGLTIVSVENLAWEVWFFGKDAFRTADADTETVRGFYSFAANSAVRIGGTGLYAYYAEDIDIPYEDEDGTGELHITLVNRSASGKTAGAGGEVRVDVHLQPIGTWT